jgi:hypothetical protein
MTADDPAVVTLSAVIDRRYSEPAFKYLQRNSLIYMPRSSEAPPLQNANFRASWITR